MHSAISAEMSEHLVDAKSDSKFISNVDLYASSILLYRACSPPASPTVPTTKIKPNLKVVATDPRTTPIDIGPPRNRREAMLSPWWPGYMEAERTEMKSHEQNGTWILRPRSDVPRGCPVLLDRWALRR